MFLSKASNFYYIKKLNQFFLHSVPIYITSKILSQNFKILFYIEDINAFVLHVVICTIHFLAKSDPQWNRKVARIEKRNCYG